MQEIDIVVPAVLCCSVSIGTEQLRRLGDVRVAIVDFANRRTWTPVVVYPLRPSHFVCAMRLLRLTMAAELLFVLMRLKTIWSEGRKAIRGTPDALGQIGKDY